MQTGKKRGDAAYKSRTFNSISSALLSHIRFDLVLARFPDQKRLSHVEDDHKKKREIVFAANLAELQEKAMHKNACFDVQGISCASTANQKLTGL